MSKLCPITNEIVLYPECTECETKECRKMNTREKELKAYIDGSYKDETKEYSFGVVLLDGELETHFRKSFSENKKTSMRNVAGEIEGALFAMNYAYQKGYSKLTIYHDYTGIKFWCTREWKAKKEWTKEYVKKYDEYSKKVNISFIKVDAHKGVYYNEKADKLAKMALGIKK